MTKKIDFYFDFVSPYSYLAHKKIINLNQRNNFIYKPILLGGLHNLGRITAPAFNERKMKNMREDCILIAKKNEIAFIWNEKFPINSLYLMRGYLCIEEKKKNKFIDVCFDAYWKNNLDISEEKILKQILTNCEIDENLFKQNIKDQKIKDELKNLTSHAFDNDVFGAPTFVINNKLFWGQDRLDYALDELGN
ncbi:2-hydroxychromene-2-carboxylate isomerase [Candidatus Pelagibacter sp.]|uniref:2-hydroxychromene-2-carboxylate isomerase n=1 Tax=Candidatus Pelagibacter sp. TaxID=2024849 RepID=UPI003F82DA47